MDLMPLQEIKLDDLSREVLNDVREAALKVNELRPLTTEVIEQVRDELTGERVYSSNAIEGNTYGLRETIAILKAGHVTPDLDRKREAAEIINLGKAIDFIQATDQVDRFSLEKFRAAHAILLRDIDDPRAGRFRDQRVMITGARRQPPHHDDVPGLVDRVFADPAGAQPVDVVLLATWVHWAIARIHPFFDGNGRMARLWQDLTLFHGGLTCAVIRPQDRREYLTALEAADEGDFNPLAQLIGQRTAATLDKYLNAQQKVDTIREWAVELVGEMSARAAQQRKLAYMRWARKMEELRYAFERCAASITLLSEEIEIQFRPYEVIDQSAWESLRSGVGATKTWFFLLSFHGRGRRLRYFFFFGRHFWSEIDAELDEAKPGVCLLISESIDGAVAHRLDSEVDHPLSIRELLVVDNTLVRKRRDHTEAKEIYDRQVSVTDVARDFIQEVFLRRLS